MKASPPCCDDPRHVGDGLDVVDDGRLAPQPHHRREGRLEARVALLALERLEQRRLLAADVGAGAAVDVDLEVEVLLAEQLRPDHAGGAGLVDGRLEDARLPGELAADVDVGEVDVERVAGERDPLDEQVRVVLHDVAVLEGAGLGLVGVDREVAGPDVLGQEGPLQAGGEAGAAAAAQVGLLHLVDDDRGLQAERLVERGVAAVGPVGGQRGGVGLAPAGGEDQRVAHVSPPRMASTFCGVSCSYISSSTSMAGAVPQEPRHSTSRSV